MQITDKQWKEFQERIAKADRDRNNRPYRGRTQQDPDSPTGYHSKPIQREHPEGERHHLTTLARMHPVFRTVKTKEQLAQLFTALRDKGVVVGDSWEQLIELPRELHDSSNPESIHRVEQELGLDNPNRYIPENGTFEDALNAVPLIAKDQQESRRRVQELQYRQQTVGDTIGGTFSGFTDAVENPKDREATANNNRVLKRQLNKGSRLLPRPFAHQAFSAARITNFGNRLMNRLDIMGSIFEQGREGSLTDTAVNRAAPHVPGLKADPETDLGKKASDLVSGVFQEARNFSNRLMPNASPMSRGL